MIKNITGGRGVYVANGYVSYPSINASNPSSGLVRFNGNSGNFEIYDGYSWITIMNNTASVDLTSDIHDLLDWVKKQKTREEDLQEKAKTNPAIADLLYQRRKIDDKLNMVDILTKN